MAQSARKAGGLYGGIQFSSGTAIVSSSTIEAAPQLNDEKSDVGASLASASTSAPLLTTVPVPNVTEGASTEPDAAAGKATAGILSTVRRA